VGADAADEDRARRLLERARHGDLEAWTRLYQDSFEGLLRHVAYLTGEVHVAEDVVQETFARALASLATFDGRCSFRMWVRTIALNLVRKHWRKTSRGARALARLPEQVSSAGELDERICADQRADALAAALDTLPSHLREAFVVFELEGASAEEAGRVLGISAGNLRVRVSRARNRIREQLRAAGLLPSEGAS
jgi:RNA polymerase sigma-70 factor (ECF subfamily)